MLNLSEFRVSCIGEGVKLCSGNGNEDVFDLDEFCSCPIKVVFLSVCGRITLIFILDKNGNLICLELGSGKFKDIS